MWVAGGEHKAEEIAARGKLAGAVVFVIAATGGVAGATDAPKWLIVVLAVAVLGGALVLLLLVLLELRAARREAGLAAGADPRRESARETRRRRIRWSVLLVVCAALLAESITLAALIQGSDHDPEFDPSPRWRVEQRSSGGLTFIRAITVLNVPAKATVELRCSGTDCKGTTRRFFPRSAPEASLTAELRRTVRGRGVPIKLHPATKIEIRVTKPRFTGEAILIEIVRRGPPTYRTFSIDEGES